MEFDDYRSKFQHLAYLRRTDGILEIRLHTRDDTIQWSIAVHDALPKLFYAIAEDRDNRVVILTGTGDAFTGPRASRETRALPYRPTSEQWDRSFYEGRRLEENLLNIEAPVICALNGPPFRHMELALLSDIVLAADTALFEDPGHFRTGDLVPGDSIHLVCSNLMGHNRARYFQLMGQTLNAEEAMQLGLVAEVHPKEKVLDRAWEIARYLNEKPSLMLRYTRLMFTQELKRQMHDLLPLGLALEGLAVTGSESTYSGSKPAEEAAPAPSEYTVAGE
jgi:enoyl-CoA hydratase/carnithine racemase